MHQNLGEVLEHLSMTKQYIHIHACTYISIYLSLHIIYLTN